jgi:succinyldiaminopimelate transaminase
VLPHPAHPRQVVFELGELHLELPFRADGVLGEDVEDQLGPIDHARLERVFECALLCRLELVVDEKHLRAGFAVRALELLELALAEIRALLGTSPMLDELPDRLDESGSPELAQLAELRLRIDPLCQHGDDERALERGVRLALAHDRIMPPTGQNPTMRLSPALAATGTYPFVRLEQAKRDLIARGVELIDFGKGDPREPTDARIRQALVDSLTEISTYPLAEGLPELRRSVAAWCGRRFGVDLDPETELIPTYGSKEAIFLLAQLVVDRESDRRLVVTTEPGYPVPDRGAVFAGAEVVQLPLLEKNGFLPDLAAVDREVWRHAAIVWINYPNNPTGAVAHLGFLGRLADLSREHGFLLASDEAYTELWFEDPPHSALEVRDRGNVAVFNTLSKRSSMTGYRSGFIAAGSDLVAALKQFRPSVGTAPQEFVQRASIVAWDDEEHVERTRSAYRRKREALLPTLVRKGVRLAGGAATMFLWLEVPGREPAEAFAARLLEHGLIVSPGTFFGPAGEGYWRLALVPTEAECERAAEILDEVL